MLQNNRQVNSSSSESSQGREASPIEGMIEDMQSRIKRLERWHTINTVIKICSSYCFIALISFFFLDTKLYGLKIKQKSCLAAECFYRYKFPSPQCNTLNSQKKKSRQCNTLNKQKLGALIPVLRSLVPSRGSNLPDEAVSYLFQIELLLFCSFFFFWAC